MQSISMSIKPIAAVQREGSFKAGWIFLQSVLNVKVFAPKVAL